MTTETEIVNGALHLIGGSRITSLDDGSKNANVANGLYEELRDDLLRSHPWNFATKRKKLAQSATAPTYEYDHAYPLPDDWLRTVSVHANDAGTGTVHYRMEQIAGQLAILTSVDELWMRYVAKVTDANLMAVDFRRALQLALARDMAVPIAASNTLEDRLDRKASRALMRARSTDAMGQFPERRPRGSWANSRGRSLPIVGD